MRIVHHFFTALLSLLITLLIVLIITYLYMETQLPNVDVLKDAHMQTPLRVYSANNKLIAEYGNKRRIPVSIKQVPKPLINAVLATEDQRFYSHPGVDPVGVFRAIKAVATSGRKVQGASTITMQVARNFFLSTKKTYSRKLNEMLLALKIEREFSKDKILELYLNKVYFGQRAYGVAAASEVYYGKSLDKLTLAQMAMIAGLPQAPSRNNPINRPKAALARRNHVLERMLHASFITAKQYQQAIKQPITAKYHRRKIQLNAPYVGEMVRQAMIAQYGEDVYEQGFTVYTSILSNLQIDAQNALQHGLVNYSKRHGFNGISRNINQTPIKQWPDTLAKMDLFHNILQPAAITDVMPHSAKAMLANGSNITIPWDGMNWVHVYYGHRLSKLTKASEILHHGDVIWVAQNAKGQWQLNQIPKAQGALVSMNPQNGAVLALVGGFDYKLNQFNRVTQAERQPGSNFKPFVYSAALAKGYTLASVINDAPVVIKQVGDDQWWRPHNDTEKFYGPTRLRVGLTKSRNLTSIRLLQNIGIQYTLNYVRLFGFDANKLPHGLSLALGSGVVTPWQLAQGYAVFANGGYRVTPYFIQTITQDNKVVYRANPANACQICLTNPHPNKAFLPNPIAPQVLTPQNAYVMTQVLQDVIKSGTGRAAKVIGRHDLAGKTGTTNDQNDAWFSGFNSRIVTSVWVGYDNLKTLHEYGSQVALPIWIDYMKTALAGMPEQQLPEPSGIIRVRIDPTTGLLAPNNQSNAIFEVFRQQYVPKRVAKNSQTNTGEDTLIDNGGLF